MKRVAKIFLNLTINLQISCRSMLDTKFLSFTVDKGPVDMFTNSAIKTRPQQQTITGCYIPKVSISQCTWFKHNYMRPTTCKYPALKTGSLIKGESHYV